MLHAEDGYSARGNFGGSDVRNMVLIYSPDETNSIVQEVGILRDRSMQG